MQIFSYIFIIAIICSVFLGFAGAGISDKGGGESEGRLVIEEPEEPEEPVDVNTVNSELPITPVDTKSNKRVNHRFSKKVVEDLNALYKKIKYPTKTEIQEVMATTELTRQQVQRWFINKRKRSKSENDTQNPSAQNPSAQNPYALSSYYALYNYYLQFFKASNLSSPSSQQYNPQGHEKLEFTSPK